MRRATTLATAFALIGTIAPLAAPLNAPAAPAANPVVQSISLAPGSSAAGASAPPLVITVNKTGVLTFNGIECYLTHKSDKWAPTRQTSLVPDSGFPQTAPDRYELKGTLKTDSGVYGFSEELKRMDAASASLKISLTGTATSDTARLYFSLNLPTPEFKGQKAYFDQAACELPWYIQKQTLYQHKPGEAANQVRVPLRNGETLALEGKLDPWLQDSRGYGPELFDLQLNFAPSKGRIETSTMEVTIKVLPSTNAQAVAFNPDVKRPPRAKPVPEKPQTFKPDQEAIAAMLKNVQPLSAIVPKGEDFVDASGKPVRFWGMNLCAFYPEHDLADKTIDNMVHLGVNLLRQYHVLRNSRDWCPADMPALMTFQNDSRTPCLKAWDHFDYLNAKARQNNIRLLLGLHQWRSYLPGDASILHVSAEDDEAWADAMDELIHLPWKKQLSPRTMLPTFDERAFAIDAEYAKTLLTHVNPYTGIAYGKDPQVLTLEIINEFSSEYTILCGNTFPEYWAKKLQALMDDYAKQHGVEPFDLYRPKTPAQFRSRSDFLTSLDESYDQRMTKIVRDLGYKGPIKYQNLWCGGDSQLRFRARLDDTIEDHAYDDPLAADSPDKFAYELTKSAVAGKTFIVGELNQTENAGLALQRKPVRSMFPLATAAYFSLQNYSGACWFCWSSGYSLLGPDGWAKPKPAPKERDADMLAGDAVWLDHFRTAGTIFKNHYLSSSAEPVTIHVDDAFFANNYKLITSGEFPIQPGWQSVHAFRKVFGPVPPDQKDGPWFQAPPPNPAISDTKEIVKDVQRKQLTFSAPKAEGLSGYLDGKPMGNVKVLEVPGDSGFATVMAVTLDDTPLAQSKRILVSKSFTQADGTDTSLCALNLKGVSTGNWAMKVTRQAASAAPAEPSTRLQVGADGTLKLPVTAWTECELERIP